MPHSLVAGADLSAVYRLCLATHSAVSLRLWIQRKHAYIHPRCALQVRYGMSTYFINFIWIFPQWHMELSKWLLILVLINYYQKFQCIPNHTIPRSCQFGTFLVNSEADRVRMKLSERTHSLWDNINAEVCTVLYDCPHNVSIHRDCQLAWAHYMPCHQHYKALYIISLHFSSWSYECTHGFAST